MQFTNFLKCFICFARASIHLYSEYMPNTLKNTHTHQSNKNKTPKLTAKTKKKRKTERKQNFKTKQIKTHTYAHR